MEGPRVTGREPSEVEVGADPAPGLVRRRPPPTRGAGPAPTPGVRPTRGAWVRWVPYGTAVPRSHTAGILSVLGVCADSVVAFP